MFGQVRAVFHTVHVYRSCDILHQKTLSCYDYDCNSSMTLINKFAYKCISPQHTEHNPLASNNYIGIHNTHDCGTNKLYSCYTENRVRELC